MRAARFRDEQKFFDHAIIAEDELLSIRRRPIVDGEPGMSGAVARIATRKRGDMALLPAKAWIDLQKLADNTGLVEVGIAARRDRDFGELDLLQRLVILPPA